MYCQKCGKQIPDSSLFCQSCGARQESVDNQGEQRSESVTVQQTANVQQPVAVQQTPPPQTRQKQCPYCRQLIDAVSTICPKCGWNLLQGWSPQQPQMQGQAQPTIIINNSNSNINAAYGGLRPKNKWAAILLCLFLGIFGAHKFYEGKVGMGILYILTLGIFGIGCFIDFIILLFKSNPYYV